MIRSLKDILVVSDMDNTLLTPEDGVTFVNQVTFVCSARWAAILPWPRAARWNQPDGIWTR